MQSDINHGNTGGRCAEVMEFDRYRDCRRGLDAGPYLSCSGIPSTVVVQGQDAPASTPLQGLRNKTIRGSSRAGLWSLWLEFLFDSLALLPREQSCLLFSSASSSHLTPSQSSATTHCSAQNQLLPVSLSRTHSNSHLDPGLQDHQPLGIRQRRA